MFSCGVICRGTVPSYVHLILEVFPSGNDRKESEGITFNKTAYSQVKAYLESYPNDIGEICSFIESEVRTALKSRYYGSMIIGTRMLFQLTKLEATIPMNLAIRLYLLKSICWLVKSNNFPAVVEGLELFCDWMAVSTCDDLPMRDLIDIVVRLLERRSIKKQTQEELLTDNQRKVCGFLFLRQIIRSTSSVLVGSRSSFRDIINLVFTEIIGVSSPNARLFATEAQSVHAIDILRQSVYFDATIGPSTVAELAWQCLGLLAKNSSLLNFVHIAISMTEIVNDRNWSEKESLVAALRLISSQYYAHHSMFIPLSHILLLYCRELVFAWQGDGVQGAPGASMPTSPTILDHNKEKTPRKTTSFDDYTRKAVHKLGTFPSNPWKTFESSSVVQIHIQTMVIERHNANAFTSSEENSALDRKVESSIELCRYLDRLLEIVSAMNARASSLSIGPANDNSTSVQPSAPTLHGASLPLLVDSAHGSLLHPATTPLITDQSSISFHFYEDIYSILCILYFVVSHSECSRHLAASLPTVQVPTSVTRIRTGTPSQQFKTFGFDTSRIMSSSFRLKLGSTLAKAFEVEEITATALLTKIWMQSSFIASMMPSDPEFRSAVLPGIIEFIASGEQLIRKQIVILSHVDSGVVEFSMEDTVARKPIRLGNDDSTPESIVKAFVQYALHFTNVTVTGWSHNGPSAIKSSNIANLFRRSNVDPIVDAICSSAAKVERITLPVLSSMGAVYLCELLLSPEHCILQHTVSLLLIILQSERFPPDRQDTFIAQNQYLPISNNNEMAAVAPNDGNVSTAPIADNLSDSYSLISWFWGSKSSTLQSTSNSNHAQTANMQKLPLREKPLALITSSHWYPITGDISILLRDAVFNMLCNISEHQMFRTIAAWDLQLEMLRSFGMKQLIQDIPMVLSLESFWRLFPLSDIGNGSEDTANNCAYMLKCQRLFFVSFMYVVGQLLEISSLTTAMIDTMNDLRLVKALPDNLTFDIQSLSIVEVPSPLSVSGLGNAGIGVDVMMGSSVGTSAKRQRNVTFANPEHIPDNLGKTRVSSQTAGRGFAVETVARNLDLQLKDLERNTDYEEHKDGVIEQSEIVLAIPDIDIPRLLDLLLEKLPLQFESRLVQEIMETPYEPADNPLKRLELLEVKRLAGQPSTVTSPPTGDDDEVSVTIRTPGRSKPLIHNTRDRSSPRSVRLNRNRATGAKFTPKSAFSRSRNSADIGHVKSIGPKPLVPNSILAPESEQPSTDADVEMTWHNEFRRVQSELISSATKLPLVSGIPAAGGGERIGMPNIRRETQSLQNHNDIINQDLDSIFKIIDGLPLSSLSRQQEWFEAGHV